MPKLIQEGETTGSQVGKNKEFGHHRSIKKIEASQDTQNHMIGGTEKTIQTIECIKILSRVTEMQRRERNITNKANLVRTQNTRNQQW